MKQKLPRNLTKKQMLIFAFLQLLFIAANAQDTGYHFPNANSALSTGDGLYWSLYGTGCSACSDDEQYAVVQPNPYSRVLYLNEFNLDVPAGATINGIEVVIARKQSLGEVNGNIADYEVYLTSYSGNLIPGGENRFKEEVWPTEQAEAIYGGPTDLWNITASLTASEINKYIGVRIRVKNLNPDLPFYSNEAQIDYVKMKVYYTPLAADQCQGSGVEIEASSSYPNVNNPKYILSEPDGNAAEIQTGGILILDLTGQGTPMPDGKITVRCHSAGYSISVPYQTASTYNADTKSFDWQPSIPYYFYPNSVNFVDNEISIEENVRYIVFYGPPASGTLSRSVYIDAVTYTCGCESPPVQPGEITGPVSVCANSTGISYSVSSVTDATSYNWSVPAGATFEGNGTTTITVNFGTTSGNVSVSALNDCGASASSTLAVTVNAVPAAPTITVDGPTEICDAGTVTLTANGAEGASYQWSGSSESTEQSIVLHYSNGTSATFTFEVEQILPGGCKSAKASQTISYYEKPNIVALIPEVLMCGGTSQSVITVSPDPAGIWLSSNTSIATADQYGVVTAHAAGTAYISYTVQGVGPCSDFQQTSTSTIYVQDNYAEITGNNGPLCGGGDAVFYLSAPEERFIYYKVTTNGITTDKWIFTYIGGDKTITVTDATGDVLLELTRVVNEPICTKDLTGAPNSTSTVTVNPEPVTTISPTTSEIDEGGSVVLTASGADEYYWIINTNLSSTTDATVTATPTINTIYKVRGTSNGCPSFAYATVYVRQLCKNNEDQYEPNNSMTNSLFTLPVGLTINANLLNSKDPDWYSLEITSTAKYTLNYQYNNGTKLPSVDLYGSNGRRLKPVDRFNVNSYNLSTGWYYIKVFTGQKTYLCYSLQVVNSGQVTGALASMEDDLKSADITLGNEETLTIWPNPAQDEFRLYNGNPSPVRVRISDVLGRTMETVENVGTGTTIVFGSAYKPGLYFVETSGEEMRQVFKVIKQQ